jgi:predicted permease
LKQAQAESDTVFAGITEERFKSGAYGGIKVDFSPTLTGLKEHVSGKLRRSMIALWSAVGMVMLIVCVNLSSLLMARATARNKEFAMRVALGARRSRLLGQLLTESLVLATAGAALGLGLAYAITNYVAHQEQLVLPLLNEVRVDAAALGWTLLITLLTTLLFGLVPGMKLVAGKVAANLQDALKDSGHGMSGGGRSDRMRSAMVVAEIALSCVLLIGAGLLLRSFVNAMRVDVGFDASHAAAMKIDYDQSGDGGKRAVVLQEILRGVLAIPGVKQACVADMLPLGRNRSWQFWAVEHLPQRGNIDVAMVRIVTPGYLAAMGMHLRTGRDFSWEDGQKAPKVVIVNQAAAQHFWPGEDAMGKETVLDGGDEGHARVIGVLSDVRQTGLEDAAAPEIYVPVMQCPPEGAELVVRSDLPVGTLAGSVLSALREPRGAGVCAGATGWDCGSFGFAAAVFAGAGDEFCRAGIDSGFAGDLWGDLVFGGAADAGDWDSHGGGRDDEPGADGRDGKDATAGAGGDCAGNRGLVCDGARDCGAVVWDGSDGWDDVCGDGGDAGRGGAGGGIYSGAAGFED